jgi:hypothetical protein
VYVVENKKDNGEIRIEGYIYNITIPFAYGERQIHVAMKLKDINKHKSF